LEGRNLGHAYQPAANWPFCKHKAAPPTLPLQSATINSELKYAFWKKFSDSDDRDRHRLPVPDTLLVLAPVNGRTRLSRNL